jgi:hypothetical protein
MPRMFDLFVQGERGLDRSEGGLGLGLALVRKLVEAHGGQVEAFSPGPGHGSEFVVHLPLAGSAVSAAAASVPRRPAGGALRILVVDDNHDSADSLALLLRRAGYAVRVTYDGPDALRVFAQFVARRRAARHRPPGHDRLRPGRHPAGAPGGSPAAPAGGDRLRPGLRPRAQPRRPASTSTWSSPWSRRSCCASSAQLTSAS